MPDRLIRIYIWGVLFPWEVLRNIVSSMPDGLFDAFDYCDDLARLNDKTN
jgi:hypothetical protein